MNLAAVARILSGFVLFFSLAQVIPLGVALGEQQRPPIDSVTGFAVGLGVGLTVAALLLAAGRRAHEGEFFRREGLAVVGLAWVIAGVLGGLPFVWSGAVPTGADAVFETISGLTTTGASVFGAKGITPAIESLPESLLLWRAMLQWLGGMGIILVFLVLLPAMGVTGKNLLSSEQVGVADPSQRPRMQEQARMLFALYVVLTVFDVLLLWLAGMDSWFDAVCHAFTTMSTGGFSTRNASIGAFDSVAIELVTIVFMFLAGANFVLMLSAVRNRNTKLLLRSPEFRAYLWITAGGIGAITVFLRLWGHSVAGRDYGNLWTCARDAAFNLVSIQTSTGYGSVDFQVWPKPALILLLLAMFVGASTGSTAGGVKVLRVIVTGKLFSYTCRHFLRPKSVEKVRIGAEVVPNSIVSSVVALTLMAATAVTAGTFALALDPRLDLLSSFSASLSMMGCTGPAITDVTMAADGTFSVHNPGGIDLGPAGSYGALYGFSKLLMSGQMVLGRLEILAPLMLFLPGLWRR